MNSLLALRKARLENQSTNPNPNLQGHRLEDYYYFFECVLQCFRIVYHAKPTRLMALSHSGAFLVASASGVCIHGLEGDVRGCVRAGLDSFFPALSLRLVL